MNGPFFRREGEGAKIAGPALGLIETSSVARGLVVADAMVKKAPVTLVLARTISPGKFIILTTGEVADVAEAMDAGIAIADATLVDKLYLAQVAPELLAALDRRGEEPSDAVGIIETFSVASSLLAADAACKAAQVKMIELRLGDGLGGKAFFVLAGTQGDVEAALFAAQTAIPSGLLLARELIARPHDDLLARLR